MVLLQILGGLAFVVLIGWAVHKAINDIVRMRIERFRLLGLLPPERDDS